MMYTSGYRTNQDLLIFAAVLSLFSRYFSKMFHQLLSSHSSGRGWKLSSFRAFSLEAPRRRVA